MFVFGTQYLRGASPERDQWERDLANIKAYGFNTIRAWLVWNAIEKSEGEIDYDYISSFLDCAKRNDLQVGLLFHMHACPAWAVQKYSKYFYVDENSLPFEPAVRPNTPSGGWPGLCYDHPEVREMEQRFIEGVIKETKKHDCVSFYEPMNEPHQWVDFIKQPSGIFCYCDASVKRFREWLANKYGDIHTLNHAWGHFYQSFDEIRPPRWTTSYADYTDFRLFNMENVTKEIQYRSDIIRRCDTKPVIAHAWGGGAVTCPQLGGMAFDDWKNAEVFDKWGYSAFPTGGKECASLGLGCDATRCAANGKEYWQSELTAGIVGMGLNVQDRFDDNTFDKISLESIRHGAKGLLYWQYRKERFGAEWAGFSLTDYDGGPTNLSLRASKLCNAIKDNENLLCNGVQKSAEVALVFSRRSYLADWCSSNKHGNKFAVDSISGYYKMFWEENITVDILHEDYNVDLSKYKMIILPSPYAIEPRFAKLLEKYVADGGTLISDPFFGAFEDTFKLSYQIPGLGFADIFGCHEKTMTSCDEIEIMNDDTSILLSGNKQLEYFRDVTADVLYKTKQGEPIILSNRYQKGRAIISGVNLGLTYSNRTLLGDDFTSSDSANASNGAKDIIMQLCRETGVTPNSCSAQGVKISLLDTDDAALAIVINSESCSRDGEIKLDFPCTSCNVIYGEADVKPTENGISIHIDADKSAMIRINKIS